MNERVTRRRLFNPQKCTEYTNKNKWIVWKDRRSSFQLYFGYRLMWVIELGMNLYINFCDMRDEICVGMKKYFKDIQ